MKISTGETGSNYLRPELIGDLVASVHGTIVECNTAYGGQRANTAMHYQVAEDHGYTALAAVDIMDEEGSMTLPVEGGSNLTENYVGSHFANYDYYVVLSHFKGHSMAGYGGAIKNISIGIASSEGKSHIHSGGTGGSMWGGNQDAFLESMAEAGKSVVDALDGNILYINVMNRLSVDCDCDGSPAEPDMHDIGILASYDPVTLDQACIDLVYAAEDGGSLVERIESRNGLHTLEHAEAIGLGSRAYELVTWMNDLPALLHREAVYLWYYFTVQLEQILGWWVLGMSWGPRSRSLPRTRSAARSFPCAAGAPARWASRRPAPWALPRPCACTAPSPSPPRSPAAGCGTIGSPPS